MKNCKDDELTFCIRRIEYDTKRDVTRIYVEQRPCIIEIKGRIRYSDELDLEIEEC